MTNQEILTKAISKAIDGGWQPFETMAGNKVLIQQWQNNEMVEVGIYNDAKPQDILTWVRELEGIIFNHDFAKALWGDKSIAFENTDSLILKAATRAWQYHLQQMVVAENPIEYLGEHLNA